jgi:small basic protein (TIGR04137 family)
VNAGLLRTRSVLKRWERIERLRKERKWNEGDEVLGLPKVRTQYKSKSGKKKKKAEEAAKKDEEEGAAPAADAATTK